MPRPPSSAATWAASPWLRTITWATLPYRNAFPMIFDNARDNAERSPATKNDPKGPAPDMQSIFVHGARGASGKSRLQ
jgi:hypothetical protein